MYDGVFVCPYVYLWSIYVGYVLTWRTFLQNFSSILWHKPLSYQVDTQIWTLPGCLDEQKYEKIQYYNWNNLKKTCLLPTSFCPSLSPKGSSLSQKFPLSFVWRSYQVRLTNKIMVVKGWTRKLIFFRKDPMSASHHSGPCTSDYPQDATSLSILTRIPTDTWGNMLPRNEML